MKKASIRILKRLWDTVHEEVLSSGDDECVAFLTSNHFTIDDRLVFLCDTMVRARSEDYLRQGALHLEISPMYVNRVINMAEYQRNTVVMVHSHPFDKRQPLYSPTDDLGEARTSETISKCLEDNPPVASLLFGQADANGRAWIGLSREKIPSSVSILGAGSFRMISSPGSRLFERHEMIDRQIKALGESVQKQLESLKVAIVGLGGTGSAVAEQLARMGVCRFTLVDHDRFESSNLSRLYGSTQKDVTNPRAKVDIIRDHLVRINPLVEIQVVRESVLSNRVLQGLARADLLFSCVDRHAPRAVLNELSYQCFVPVIDVGVGLRREKGTMVGGSARATVIGPGLPCLLCQDIVRPEMITAEHLSPEEYRTRRAEGYVNNAGQDVASVVYFTNIAGSLGIMQLVNLLMGRSHHSTVMIDSGTLEVVKLTCKIENHCVCIRRLGKGFKVPFSVAD